MMPEGQANLPEGGPAGPVFNQGQGGWGRKIKEWLKAHGVTVVLPIVALIILGFGIYFYSKETPVAPEFLSESTEQITSSSSEETTLPAEKTTETEEKTATQESTQQKAEKTQQETASPNTVEKECVNCYHEKAEKGEGITHLARKALQEYLSENNVDFELTPEHKIYIEDYMKDRTGSRFLEVGEEITFSVDLIQEAINSAHQLTQEQLNRITVYAQMVPSLYQ